MKTNIFLDVRGVFLSVDLGRNIMGVSQIGKFEAKLKTCLR